MAVTPEIRKLNKRNTYLYIYRHKECSKQELASSVGQSLPTVNQNLNELFEDGFVRVAGHYKSTGGRKPMVLQCTPEARVAVGVQILAEQATAVLLDLYGEVLACEILREPYSNEEAYFKKAGRFIANFVDSAGYSESKLLGIAVATQGVADYDHKKLVYGRILNNYGLSADQFSTYIGKPCILMHDSETAAFAESFHRPNLRDSSYIFLNDYLGSASIIGGNLYRGNHGRGQLLEHVKLVRGGRKCYCGQSGCAESYCGAYGLRKLSGLSTDEFFRRLRSQDTRIQNMWDEYLDHLALLLHNVLMTMDVDIILGGLLRKYMVPGDLKIIEEKIRLQTDFDIPEQTITLEYITDYPAARGAALYLVRDFLDNFEA
ncbi:MAG: ROK family transcriptional regulator [Lachnospiraceae bacterium]|nr:ROK family transcriptional regulator [Lachnospiraceae bacterium]